MATKKELIVKVFHNEPAERIPVGFWFHFLPDELHDHGLEHPEALEKNRAGHRAYIEAFDPDFVKVMTDGLFVRPYETWPKVDKASDLNALEPLPHDHPYFSESVRLARDVRAMAGDDRLVAYNVFAPLFHMTRYLNGTAEVDTVYAYLQEDPAAVLHAMDVLAEDLCHLVKLVMTEGGMDGIYLSVSDSKRLIPVEMYQKYVAPAEIRILEAANALGDNQILHICGYRGRQNILSLYRDYPVAVFNWAVHEEGMSLAEGKRFFHNKCVIGGFDQMPGSLINAGTKADIQAFVAQTLADCGKTGVIIGADCTVPSDTPIEHLMWAREKAAELSE